MHPSKEALFHQFLLDWKGPYENAKGILWFLNTYPEVIARSFSFKWLHQDELDRSQQEWIWLLSLINYPQDIAFFKPWWVPVNALEYDQFIDISTPSFELFTVDFYGIKPYRWFRYPLLRSCPEFMTNIEVGDTYLRREIQHSRQIHKDFYKEMLEYRIRVGLSKRIQPFSG